MDNIKKNEKIKATLNETRERRKELVCKVYDAKIVSGKLSKEKKEHLDALFKEAKWLRNSELSKDDLKLLDRNAKEATVKVGDVFETRMLTHLSSQMRQSVVDQIRTDVNSLSKSKKKGNKVGRLKFKSVCNSINLTQFGKTYRIDFEKNLIFIQGFKKPFKVRGLKQIPKDAEIANAKIVRKPSGYYFHITVFCKPRKSSGTKQMGLDFGIENNLTTSSGDVFNINVPETKGVKLASKRMNKAFVRNGRKKTKNHNKRRAKLRRAYEHQNNIKRDLANKICNELLKNSEIIAMQDEMIANWHKGWFGKQVQRSTMGFIKAKLKTSSKVLLVEKSFPSTQICPICGKTTKHELKERTFRCSHCGYFHPSRDVKAATTILSKALESS